VCDCQPYDCNCSQALNCNVGSKRPMTQNCGTACVCNCVCDCDCSSGDCSSGDCSGGGGTPTPSYCSTCRISVKTCSTCNYACSNCPPANPPPAPTNCADCSTCTPTYACIVEGSAGSGVGWYNLQTCVSQQCLTCYWSFCQNYSLLY
jgi:hypothetical protein